MIIYDRLQSEPYRIRAYLSDLVSEVVDLPREQVAFRCTHEHHLHSVLVHAQLINWTMRALLDTAS